MTTREIVEYSRNAQSIATKMVAEFGPLDAPGRLQHLLDRCHCCDRGINHAKMRPAARTKALMAFDILKRTKAEIVAEMDRTGANVRDAAWACGVTSV